MEDLRRLIGHPLFRGISEADLTRLFFCLNARKKAYYQNEYILMQGDPVKAMGIVLQGKVFMEGEDYSGNSHVYTEMHQGDVFGEIFIGYTPLNSFVNYRAVTDCLILYIEYDAVLEPCSKSCRCHWQLLENMIKLLALKSRMLTEKIEIISKPSLRQRILAYLSFLARRQEEETLHSPLNKTEMAEFLCVNRSSMLRELGRMEDEGILENTGNHYRINKRES